MSFHGDRQIKGFLIFLALYAVLLSAASLWFSKTQINAVKSMYLERNEAIASSLLDQGVSREIIANALVSQETNGDGKALLKYLGIGADTAGRFLPFFGQFQNCSFLGTAFLCGGLILSLFTGTLIFLGIRNRLYVKADKIINAYLNNDYSCHLPQNREGELFHLFASAERLASMLQSRNEYEHRTKEFLKRTISDISHQLKTPLAALMLYQEIIEEEPDNGDTVKLFSEKSGDALRRMEQLILSMLKITQLDAGNIVFEKKRCKVKDVVLAAVSELMTRAACEHKQVIMEGNPDEIFLCDQNWTREAIENLVKNALDHTEEEGIIRITWECSPAMARIIVSDNGSGIGPEEIHHIFKRFYRGESSIGRPGIGLGLSLAKSIIEEQGGLISVESELNRGTAFTLSFFLDEVSFPNLTDL